MKVHCLDLDHTLDSGQVFRWSKEGDTWKGVVRGRLIELRQTGDDLEIKGMDDQEISNYLRLDDDLGIIYRDISKDPCIAELLKHFQGLRLIRQDIWECSASYLLASYSNVPRIKKMIENVCMMYGNKISENRYSFPTSEQLADESKNINDCRLGYRAEWLLEYAERVRTNDFDLTYLRSLDYEHAIEYLKTVKGIGDKVADCIALFSLGHLQACPVDVRIARAMRERYCVSGSYKKVSSYARRYFGPYAGYAQEYLYIAEERSRKNEMKELTRRPAERSSIEERSRM